MQQQEQSEMAKSESGAQLAVHESPQRARLELLEKEHARLLRDVAKKRQSLELLRGLARDVLSEVTSAAGPLQEQLVSHISETRRMLEKLIAERGRLNGRQRRITQEIYDELVEDLSWDLRYATEPPDESEDSQDDDFDHDAFADEAFGDAPFGEGERGPGEEWGDVGPDAEVAPARQPEAGQTHSLRELFKRLVSKLHPDKVRDEDAKAERTAAMKEVTQAYQAGDLARLIELESDLAQVLSENASGELAARAQRLERQSRELRKQLRELTAERKELRDSLPFRVDLRAPNRLKEQLDEQVTLLMAEVKQELEQFRVMRDFVQRFRDGKMAFDEFAAGPGSHTGDLEDALEAVLSELFAGIEHAEPRRRKAKKRATRSSRRSRKR